MKLIENKDAILDALRNKKYLQSRNHLVQVDPDRTAYCCIGAAAKECGWGFRNSTYVATGFAVQYLGFESLYVKGKKSRNWIHERFPHMEYKSKPPLLWEVLVMLNDTAKWGFPQIAEFLEMVIDEHIQLQASEAPAGDATS